MNSSSLFRAEGGLLLAAFLVLAAGLALAGDISRTVCLGLLFVALLALGATLLFLTKGRKSLSQIASVLNRAARGEMEERVIKLGERGELQELGDATNRFLDISDAFIRETTATLLCVRDGKHHRRILEHGMVGTFGQASAKMNEAVGTLSTRLSQFDLVVRDFEENIGGVASTLSSAVAGLNQSSAAMEKSANETQSQSTVISSSAEETSNTVAAVASATEELTRSIEVIAHETQKTLDVTSRANRVGEDADDALTELTNAISDIGSVLDLIRAISDKTRLLALNATIEAAHAGDNGHGFAVVAHEVKSLAGQTAEATDAIVKRIQDFEEKVSHSRKASQDLTQIIADISQAATTISASVTDQLNSTQEISASLQQASLATQDVSRNVGEVATAAGRTGEVATVLSEAASQVNVQSDKLKADIASFMERTVQLARVGGSHKVA